MSYKLYFLLWIIFPIFAFGQSSPKPDTLYKKELTADCLNEDGRGMVFVKVEVSPSLNVEKEVFENALYAYLKSNKVDIKNDSVRFRILVTTKSKILEVIKESGKITNEKKVVNALVALSGMWNSAMQNGRKVCAYVRLKLTFTNDKVNAVVSP